MPHVRSGVTLLLLLAATPLLAGNHPVLRAKQPVPSEYIVVLEDNLPKGFEAVVGDLIIESRGRAITSYPEILRGFAVRMTDENAQKLAKHPWVKSVEENAVLSVAASQSVPSGPLVPNTSASMWYLDRIDQVNPWSSRLDGIFEYCATGEGVRVYVVDTGVLPSHSEFGTRVDSAPTLDRT